MRYNKRPRSKKIRKRRQKGGINPLIVKGVAMLAPFIIKRVMRAIKSES